MALWSMAYTVRPSGLMARPSKPRFVRLPAVLPASLVDDARGGVAGQHIDRYLIATHELAGTVDFDDRRAVLSDTAGGRWPDGSRSPRGRVRTPAGPRPRAQTVERAAALTKDERPQHLEVRNRAGLRIDVDLESVDAGLVVQCPAAGTPMDSAHHSLRAASKYRSEKNPSRPSLTAVPPEASSVCASSVRPLTKTGWACAAVATVNAASRRAAMGRNFKVDSSEKERTVEAGHDGLMTAHVPAHGCGLHLGDVPSDTVVTRFATTMALPRGKTHALENCLLGPRGCHLRRLSRRRRATAGEMGFNGLGRRRPPGHEGARMVEAC